MSSPPEDPPGPLSEGDPPGGSGVSGTLSNLLRPAGDEVAQWEWCHITARSLGQGSFSELPDSAWGIYSEENNDLVEEAFQCPRSHAEVSIVARRYHILFDGCQGSKSHAGYMIQYDPENEKVRAVRRRLLRADERQARLRTEPKPGECAICLEDFDLTPEVPTLKLGGCGHEFHRACAQPLADDLSGCPLCRSKVEWHHLTQHSRLSDSGGGRASEADPNSSGFSLLIASQRGNLGEVRSLLGCHADVNAGSAKGATPVIAAAQRGHLLVVEALLDARADIHMATGDGNTAIFFAAKSGFEQVAELLWSKGADVHTPNAKGESAADKMPLVRTWQRKWAERKLHAATARSTGAASSLSDPEGND